MMYFMVEGRRVRRRHAFTPVALTMASTDELRLDSIMAQNPDWVFKRAVAFVRSRCILAR
jgi:hypothetical protein